MKLFRIRVAGFSLLEVMFVMGILGGLLVVIGTLLVRAQNAVRQTTRAATLNRDAYRVLDKIADEIEESSSSLVWTGKRLVQGGSVTVDSEISVSGEGYYQCVDDECPWSWNVGDSTRRLPHALFGNHFSRSGTVGNETSASGGTLTSQGRLWTSDCGGTCPRCGNALVQRSYYGIIAFATPRNPSGAFVRDEGSGPGVDWQGLVFLVPYHHGGEFEIRRYCMYFEEMFDLGAGYANVTVTCAESGANPWGANTPAGMPTMCDLLDFDGDDAINPDPGMSDATHEGFWIDVDNIYFLKQDGTRRFYVEIDRDTGETLAEYSNSGYTASTTVEGRKPKVLVRGLADVDFSTFYSNPYDQTVNPLGVREGGAVRVAVVLERGRGKVNGGDWMEAVRATVVKPNN